MDKRHEAMKAIRAPSVPLDNGPRFGMSLQEREKFSLRGVVYQVRRIRRNGKLTIKILGKGKPNEPTYNFSHTTFRSRGR